MFPAPDVPSGKQPRQPPPTRPSSHTRARSPSHRRSFRKPSASASRRDRPSPPAGERWGGSLGHSSRLFLADQLRGRRQASGAAAHTVAWSALFPLRQRLAAAAASPPPTGRVVQSGRAGAPPLSGGSASIGRAPGSRCGGRGRRGVQARVPAPRIAAALCSGRAAAGRGGRGQPGAEGRGSAGPGGRGSAGPRGRRPQEAAGPTGASRGEGGPAGERLRRPRPHAAGFHVPVETRGAGDSAACTCHVHSAPLVWGDRGCARTRGAAGGGPGLGATGGEQEDAADAR